jgi:hypothetical protein
MRRKPEKLVNFINAKAYCLALVFILIGQITFAQYTWTRILGEPLLNEVSWDCLTLRDSNFLAVGEKTVRRINNTTLPQSYLVKFDRKGTVIWQKTFGDSIYPNYSYSAKEDPSGNIYFTSNWNTPRLIKLDKFGNILWSRSFGAPLVDIGGLDFTDNYRNLIIKGSNEAGTLITAGLTKLDTSGNLIWSKSYSDAYEYGVSYNSFLITESGYYLAGRRKAALTSISFILKTDTSGKVEWQKYMNHEITFYSICQNSGSTFIATGIRTDFWSMHCVKFDSKGDTIWQKSISIDSLAAGFSIVKTLDNKFAIATSAYEQNAKIAIIDSMGNLNSIITHYFPPDYVIVYQGIDNASDSGFVLSGYVEINESGSVDFLTVKTDKSGNTTPIGIQNLSEVANEFKIDINVYPNPFNSQTIININLTKADFLVLKLYDILGREMSTIYSGNVNGIYTQRFEPELYSLSSGIYFLRAETFGKNLNKIAIKKITYIK